MFTCCTYYCLGLFVIVSVLDEWNNCHSVGCHEQMTNEMAGGIFPDSLKNSMPSDSVASYLPISVIPIIWQDNREHNTVAAVWNRLFTDSTRIQEG